MISFGRRIADAWQRFWFTPADVAPLAAIRIGTGLVLLYSYVTTVPDVMSYLSPHAWVDSAAVEHLRNASEPSGVPLPHWSGISIWFYVTTPWAIGVSYAVFLASIVCFTLGLYTRIANVVVWVGHLSFIHRAFLSWSGMDTVLALLTFYLMFAPSGAALSLDCRHVRTRPAQQSWIANVALRLIQIHMCVIYLCAGLSKLQGNRWWDGTAVWMTIALYEYAPIDITWLGRLGDNFCLLLSNFGVLLTLGFEIGFAFLIWNPKARPVILGLALLLHAGIGFFMGMAAFGMAMLAGVLSFVDADSIREFAAWCSLRLSRIRMTPATAAKLPRAA